MVTKKNACRFTLRVVLELAARLEKVSAQQRITKNALIVSILWKHLQQLSGALVENKGSDSA